jgi:hypothetical protein
VIVTPYCTTPDHNGTIWPAVHVKERTDQVSTSSPVSSHKVLSITVFGSHQGKYCKRLLYRQKSFFPRTVAEWNALPSTTVEAFKIKI